MSIIKPVFSPPPLPSLLQQVLSAARAAGLDQRALAQTAGIKPETISRAKKRESLDLATLAALAKEVAPFV